MQTTHYEIDALGYLISAWKKSTSSKKLNFGNFWCLELNCVFMFTEKST